MDHGFFLSLDLAIGGAYPNTVCGCTSPSAQTSAAARSASAHSASSRPPAPRRPPLAAPPIPNGPERGQSDRQPRQLGLVRERRRYQIKGVTFGPRPIPAEAHMADLRSLGVNTVRTWARRHQRATARPGSGQRHQVINGFWLGQGNDY